jgi:hypothetical protein
VSTPAQETVKKMRGKWYGSYGMCRCPNHDDHTPSLRIRDGETGALLVSCYSGCDRLEIIEALKKRSAWQEPGRERPRQPTRSRRKYASRSTAPAPRAPSRPELDRIETARAIWEATTPSAGTIVERYWHEARGLSIPIPAVIHFGESVPYGYQQPDKPPPQRLPAMVAKVQAPDGDFAGIHATFLLPNGADKARNLPSDRLIFGCVGSGAIRLADAPDELAIGEGIESTASYMQEFKVAGWAAMNTSGLKSIVLPPPPIAFMVTLIGENDEGPSETAIAAATARLRLEGRLVGAAFPAEGFKDFNDPLRQAA